MAKLNFIDLFAGAGGLSEGFINEGFESLAYVEMDKDACETLKTREVYHYLKNNKKLNLYKKYLKKEISKEELYSQVPKVLIDSVFNETISKDTISSLFDNIKQIKKEKKIKEVDLIIGGPPCQAYSLVGRARVGKENNSKDPRNYLYKYYFQFLEEFKPKMFVFENVPGLLTAGKGKYFEDMKELFEKHYNVEAKTLLASDFGVLQNRRRVIIVGTRKDCKNLKYPEVKKIENKWKVYDLLEDLPKIKAGQNIEVGEYGKESTDYLNKFKLREKEDILTDHISRPHNDHDKKIYSIAIKKWNKNRERFKYTDLPEEMRTHNNTRSFVDRFKVVAGNENASQTMVAHISKDGHYYIHPDLTQCRSLTVREAARIQSFPDNYFFEGSRSAKFKQIGNAVPPLLGRILAKGIKKQF
ncbi:MAG: DNA (cytosine-5-)-methyltransferase [Nanoarchaeota archaeon]|nr:DNA (cytosine-5-)-methyltransferase [Nanoarchaeota archaeon]